jgi:hypothetical protein
MAFIVKGRHNKKGETKQEVKPTPAPSKQKKKINPFRKERKKDINNDYQFDKNKTYLVVGGKVKEISPKSKYLLDMLIIEEEN